MTFPRPASVVAAHRVFPHCNHAIPCTHPYARENSETAFQCAHERTQSLEERVVIVSKSPYPLHRKYASLPLSPAFSSADSRAAPVCGPHNRLRPTSGRFPRVAGRLPASSQLSCSCVQSIQNSGPRRSQGGSLAPSEPAANASVKSISHIRTIHPHYPGATTHFCFFSAGFRI